jgi:hypothetical protein
MTAAAGASKALRGATNRLGKKLRIKVRHTRRPRADFDRLLNNVRDPAKVAEHYYKLGLRRGLILATDYVVDGTFELGKDDVLLSSDKITVDVRLGLPGQAVKPRNFKFNADDIGFDD